MLGLVCAFIDDDLADAVALVDCAGPSGEHNDPQAIEGYVTEVAFLDIKYTHPLALVMGRRRVELARATVVAIASVDLGALDLPIDVRHSNLLLIWID